MMETNAEPEGLDVWTITEKPKDYPEHFVARRHVIANGQDTVTRDALVSLSLEGLRDALRRLGLVCMPRSDGDDPVIVESWF